MSRSASPERPSVDCENISIIVTGPIKPRLNPIRKETSASTAALWQNGTSSTDSALVAKA